MTNLFDTVRIETDPDGTIYLFVKWGFSTRRFLINADLAAQLRIDIGKAIGVEYIPKGSVVFIDGTAEEVCEFRELLNLALQNPEFRVISNHHYTIAPVDQVQTRDREEMLKQWVELGNALGIPTVEVAVSERVKAAYAEGWEEAFDPGALKRVSDLPAAWEHSKAKAALGKLRDEPSTKVAHQLGQ